jgi:hypothetical protein
MNKTKIFGKKNCIVIAAILTMVVIASACSTPAANTSIPITTASPTTTFVGPRTTPPTVEELTAEHFTDPEIPRITCEQIKIIIDEAKAAGKFKGSGGMMSWDDFFIIDVRSSKGEVLGAPGFNQPGHILGARSMPMTWYWVTDPREDPKQEELESYDLELKALEENIKLLPKNLPVYVYDGTADDEAACIVAKMLLEAGFPPENVKVIWKGVAYWTYDLQYPLVQGDYNFEGE